MRHQHGKGYEMQSDKRLCQSFVVAHQAAKARHPGEAALDYPTTRQQHKATLGRRQLDDFQADTVGLGSSSRLVAGVTLIDKRDWVRSS